MRNNARVHNLAPVRQPGQNGRPPLKGAQLPTLAEIAATAKFQPATVTSPDGRQRTVHVHELICLWYTPFYMRPVKVILIRNPGNHPGVRRRDRLDRRRCSSRRAALALRQPLDDRDPQSRGEGTRRRPSPQPRPESGRANRSVRAARPDDHDLLVPASRRRRHRPHDPSPQRPVVPPEDHNQLQRHASCAQPRTDPPRVFGHKHPR